VREQGSCGVEPYAADDHDDIDAPVGPDDGEFADCVGCDDGGGNHG
jgi:hypothetical protein